MVNRNSKTINKNVLNTPIPNYSIGLEAEGKFKGLSTLFVKNFDECTLEEIIDLIIKEKVKQVYVGSRGTLVRDFNKLERLRDTLNAHDKIILTCRLERIEFSEAVFLKDIHYVFSFLEPVDLSLRVDEKKDSKVTIYEYPSVDGIVTLEDDINYLSDKSL